MSNKSPEETIKTFLKAMEARDLETAQAMMAPGANLVFPGGKIFHSQADMVAASQDRYQWVKKTFDLVDVVPESDRTVVYIMGRLYGVNRHGVSFDGIRFIDRFTIEDGLIASQEVWNDLAESGVLDRQG